MNHKNAYKVAVFVCLLAIVSSFAVFCLFKTKYIQVLSVVFLVFAPLLIEKKFEFHFPAQLLFCYDFFLVASMILGTGFNFYSLPLWDKYLHVFAGYIMSALGFSIFLNLGADDQIKEHYLLVGLASSSFAGLLGIIWEIYEYLGDLLFDMNMQRYLNLNGVPYVGKLALDDTMGDLIADLIGAFVFFLIFWYQIKQNKIKVENWRFEKVIKWK